MQIALSAFLVNLGLLAVTKGKYLYKTRMINKLIENN